MKNLLRSTILTFFCAFTAFGQVDRKVIVEHFTNTRCSICANRNPGFYNNLDDFPEVIHLAIHPSSPYSNCVFNQHNASENDARTNFYGIYRGTPRLVIQGDVISASADYSSADLINDKLGQLSAFELKMSQSFTSGMDSIMVKIQINKVSTSSEVDATVFAAIAESEVDYSAPNGENVHFDVFRESVFGEAGMTVQLPQNVNDSVIHTETIEIDPVWDITQVYALSLIQKTSDKSVLQAESLEGSPILNVEDSPEISQEIRVYPNPFHINLRIETGMQVDQITVFDLTGQPVFNELSPSTDLNLGELPPGIYIAQIKAMDSQFTTRIVKQ